MCLKWIKDQVSSLKVLALVLAVGKEWIDAITIASTWVSAFSAMVQLATWPVGLTWNEHAQITAAYNFQKHCLHTLHN